MDRLLEELVALERSALDRWIKLDPQRYLDLQAPAVTYFDPFTERRVRKVSWLAGIPLKSTVGVAGCGRSSTAIGRTCSRSRG